MANHLPAAETVLKHIPDPVTCRAMLARAVREAELLRRLLKVSLREADYRSRAMRREEAPPCHA
jgi:hypothetical protein